MRVSNLFRCAGQKPSRGTTGAGDPVGSAEDWFLALQLCIIFEHSKGKQHEDPQHAHRVYEALWAGGVLEMCREARRRVLGDVPDDWGPGLATGVSVVCLPSDWGDMTDADDAAAVADDDADFRRAVAYDFFFGDGWYQWRRSGAVEMQMRNLRQRK